ncbi:MAG: Hsp33 family molecular chaperone HslO [Alphaproteobacteria bacterium]|nr:Hsp33 family molecular chaperone HslO [Alphaproteobacteria bacterium]
MSRIANDNSDKTAPREPDDNIIQPFQLEVSGLRGRVVRIGSILEAMQASHAYPQPVAALLAETAATALLLSSMLKYEGVFTLQTSGDGPVRTLVADVTTSGHIRCYAGFSEDVIKAMEAADKRPDYGAYAGFDMGHLCGKGYLAFTVDQGEHMERYQGIVALSGPTLADTVQHYFDQSEQIGTSIKVAAHHDEKTGWRAGAIMLQRMPDPSIGVQGNDTVLPIRPDLAEAKEEDWSRARILLQSVTEKELVNADLHSHELLVRLFHEEGVRIFPAQPVINKCRCSGDRVARVLATLSDDDREHASQDGVIEMKCEFCSKTYRFDTNTLSCIEVEPNQVTH